MEMLQSLPSCSVADVLGCQPALGFSTQEAGLAVMDLGAKGVAWLVGCAELGLGFRMEMVVFKVGCSGVLDHPTQPDSDTENP